MSESLSPCVSDTADVKFLDRTGVVTTDGQGFVTVCLKKNSTSYGWALVRDDNYTSEQIKHGVLYAACRQNGYFGSPMQMSQIPTYVHHCRLLLLIYYKLTTCIHVAI